MIDGLEALTLYREPRGAALAAGHPLTSKPELSMEEFIAEPTFDFPTADPVWRDFWAANLTVAGAHPDWRQSSEASTPWLKPSARASACIPRSSRW